MHFYLIFEKAESHRKTGKRLIKEARSVVVEKIGLPIVEENQKSRIFETVLEDDSFVRLDALFNNPLREKLISILKKHKHKALGKLIIPQKENKIIP